MKKMARSRFVITRDTVVPPVGIVGTKYIQCLVIVDKAGYEQIQLTVVVIVKPHGAGGPAGCGHTCFLRDVSKCSVAVVVIKNIAAITCDIEIDPAIAVIIGSGDAHTKTGSSHSCFVGDVSESAVMIIMVEGVLQRGRRCKEIRWSTVDQINIHPTVVVIIQKGTTGADRFRQVSVR